MVDLIANANILVNISTVQGKDAIILTCNSGVKIVDRFGDLSGYRTVRCKLTDITNILLMSRAKTQLWVIFDSKGGDLFRIVLPDREVRFQLIPNGLYYFGDADRESSVLTLNTVSENCEGFTQRMYEGDREARQVLHQLGFPSEWYFENMVHSKMIVNCPVTFDNIKRLNLFLVLMLPR